eukprot:3232747-Ditylum_brightwellii.AAC.1
MPERPPPPARGQADELGGAAGLYMAGRGLPDPAAEAVEAVEELGERLAVFAGTRGAATGGRELRGSGADKGL